MAHVREQVRAAVGTLLSAAPTNWQRVFKSRISPARDVLPYLLVYTEAEESDALDIHAGFVQSRDVMLTVRGRTRIIDGEDLENTMDDMAEEIEQTLTSSALNSQLSNKLKSLVLTRTESGIVEIENERTFAEIALDWRVQVHTVEGTPETLI